jgi:hypothetical protein
MEIYRSRNGGSPTNTQPLGSNTEQPSVSAEVLDEFYFLRDIVN